MKLLPSTLLPQNFASLVFTPAIKALQERYGSRRQYARMEQTAETGHLGPDEIEFLSEQDSFYMASTGSTGWPYIQHRGGAKGFLKVIDDHTLAFADFRGNKQFITAGNMETDNRVAMILIDYPRQARIKILGRAETSEAADWLARLRDPKEKTPVERVFIIHVEAFDWNCPQHITQRFTEDQIKESLEPFEKKMRELEQENQRLRAQLKL